MTLVSWLCHAKIERVLMCLECEGSGVDLDERNTPRVDGKTNYPYLFLCFGRWKLGLYIYIYIFGV